MNIRTDEKTRLFNFLFLAFMFSACSKDNEEQLPSDLLTPYIVMKVDGNWWILEKKTNDNFFEVVSTKIDHTKIYSTSIIGTSTNGFSPERNHITINFETST